MKRSLLMGWLSTTLALVALAACGRSSENSTQPATQTAANLSSPLIIYVAAGLKAPMEKIAADYEKEIGQRVQVQFGGSNTLLANIAIAKTGDLFVPADDSFVEMAREKDLIAEVLPIATMQAVVAVPKGNPKNIASWADLTRQDMRLSLANPGAAAISAVTKKALGEKWTTLWDRKLVEKPTVTEIATDVAVGAVDAGIVWDITVQQFNNKLDAVQLEDLKDARGQVKATILKSSKQATNALRFARFVAARDRGLLHFEQAGFKVAEGDKWARTPELKFLAGAMLRPAVDATITQFEQREGVRISRVYNGCGILVAQMKAGDKPDAYFACEPRFMKEVADMFLDATDISTNQLVIAVPKGNPKNIKTLNDLGKPGIKLGVGHEQQCALGAITKDTLIEGKVYNKVRANVVVESPTGDLLVNQLVTGSLDAAIVYVSNTAYLQDKLEAYAVGIPCAVVAQPIAVRKGSDHKQLMARLLTRIKQEESRETFEALGFGWQVKK